MKLLDKLIIVLIEDDSILRELLTQQITNLNIDIQDVRSLIESMIGGDIKGVS
jgi:hypothetical protein